MFFNLLFRDSANAGPDCQKLCARYTHIWGIRKVSARTVGAMARASPRRNRLSDHGYPPRQVSYESPAARSQFYQFSHQFSLVRKLLKISEP